MSDADWKQKHEDWVSALPSNKRDFAWGKGVRSESQGWRVIRKGGSVLAVDNDPNRPRILVLEALSGSCTDIRLAGGTPISVYPQDFEEVEEMLATCHGVLFTGGGDVDPRLYTDKINTNCYGVDQARDSVEMIVLEEARRRGLPVFGICRGLQIINVEAGGTLWQNIPDQLKGSKIHARGRHAVKITEGTKVHTAFAAKYAIVKSLHHQAVRVVAPGFKVTSRAADGTVESIESDDGRVAAVQFHPEMMRSDRGAQRLFEGFVQDARAAMPKILMDAAPRTTSRNAEKVLPDVDYPNAYCADCGIAFDDVTDWIDHKAYIHWQWDDEDGAAAKAIEAVSIARTRS